MNAVVTGLGVVAITFGGGLFGLLLQRILPKEFASGALGDMTGAVGGPLTLLTGFGA